MGAGRKICCSIMLCQMTAILSAVAFLYLFVIVVIPSMQELDYGFNPETIMCTTVQATDIAAGGKKVQCDWSTCGEWCLSKSSNPCMQIYVMPRHAGADVTIEGCKSAKANTCSALNITKTGERLCKKGECKDMSGLFNCSKHEENPCRDITPAYICTGGTLNKTTISCNEVKCSSRLSGVYFCEEGSCNKIEDKTSFKDCERKCEDLDFQRSNTIIFSKEKMYNAECSSAISDIDKIDSLNRNNDWKSGRKYLFIFCSSVSTSKGSDESTSFQMSDCFNATLRNRGDVSKITSFLKLIDALINRTPQKSSDWLIESEESLRILNDTKLRINSEGCVNSLKGECSDFFSTHATDGRDGKTPDRFPCFYTNKTTEFVIGKFDPDAAYLYMLLASTVPASLFVVACFCLFFCSKSVGVDEGGNLKVTLLKRGITAGNASEL